MSSLIRSWDGLGNTNLEKLAHVDVVKVHGDVLDAPPYDRYEQVVEAAVPSGTAVDVSSGPHKPIGEIYQHPSFLVMLSGAGAPITLASDAHEPAHSGQDTGRLTAAARDAGYTDHLVFDQRTASLRPLPTESVDSVPGNT